MDSSIASATATSASSSALAAVRAFSAASTAFRFCSTTDHWSARTISKMKFGSVKSPVRASRHARQTFDC